MQTHPQAVVQLASDTSTRVPLSNTANKRKVSYCSSGRQVMLELGGSKSTESFPALQLKFAHEKNTADEVQQSMRGGQQEISHREDIKLK